VQKVHEAANGSGLNAEQRRDGLRFLAAVGTGQRAGTPRADDVLALYVHNKPPDHARPDEAEGTGFVMKAWRYRERQNYRATDRRTRKHITKFAFVALHTGSRRASCAARPRRNSGHGTID
jgi:hypothetical protein